MKTAAPLRSVLFVPAENARALRKARDLAADAVIIDLEDGVAESGKLEAREAALPALRETGWRPGRRILRINGIDTPWWRADLAAAAGERCIDAILLPKVDTVEAVTETMAALRSAVAEPPPLWVMCENARGVQVLEAVLARWHEAIELVVMGTADLSLSLRLPDNAGNDRIGLLNALSHCLLVARAAGVDILDGVHLQLGDLDGFRASCEQGWRLGFDGKTLIHPEQIAIANEVFAPAEEAVREAERIIAGWHEAELAGRGVCVVDGRLVERLHMDQAQRIIAIHEVIARAGN